MRPETHEQEFNQSEPGFILGQIEYSARTAIRDLIRTHGFENARDLVAGFINDEAKGKRS